jgi:LysM repeat protein
MKQLISCFFSVISLFVFAQPDKAEREIVDGKKYYVHIVKPGNTMWWIHETYKVPVDEIVKANPGTEKGVSVGQRIKVPIATETINYTVLPKETLYGISKKFEVSVEALVSANPGSENGVQVGQTLKIENVYSDVVFKNKNTSSVQNTNSNNISETVKTNESVSEVKKESKSEVKPTIADTTLKTIKLDPIKIPLSDTIIEHLVRDGETLYTLSKRYMVTVEDLQKLNQLKSSRIKPGDTIKIQIKKEQQKNIPIRTIEPPIVVQIDSSLLFPKKSSYKIALLLPFNLDKQDGNGDMISGLATEFYMGAKLAFDSLSQLGMNAEVFVFDVKNDSVQTKKLLSKNELKGLDLLFGPLFPENAEVVARWCRQNKVRMICPALVPSSIVKSNTFVYTSVPTDVQLQEGLARYVSSKFNSSQTVLIRPAGEKDVLMYEAFRSAFLAQKGHPKLIEATLDNYVTFVKRDLPTVLIFPTNDKALTLKFMNSMNSNASKFNTDLVRICGTKEWLGMDEMKAHFRERFHFHYSSPNDLDYDNEYTKAMLRIYRKSYNADLTKMAAQGFDVVYSFCSETLLGMHREKLIMNDFQWSQKGAGNGFQNSKCFVLEQRDYELINVGE